jgi:hypothetical protein
MSKAGLPSEVLPAKIKSSVCDFDTSPVRLQQPKSSGVPDAVILAMIQAPVGQADAHSTSPDPPATASSAASAPPDVSSSDGKVRVLVTDSQSWETRGRQLSRGASSWIAGGARPQTVEIINTLKPALPGGYCHEQCGESRLRPHAGSRGRKGPTLTSEQDCHIQQRRRRHI